MGEESTTSSAKENLPPPTRLEMLSDFANDATIMSVAIILAPFSAEAHLGQEGGGTGSNRNVVLMVICLFPASSPPLQPDTRQTNPLV